MKAVIFDMDGVIVNSEPLHQEVERNMVKSFGGNLTLDSHQKFVGTTDEYMWSYFKEKLNIDMEVDHILDLKKTNFIKRIDEIDLVDHVIDLINLTKKEGYKIALASSNNKKTVYLILEKFNLIDKFDFIITGTEVNKGKPDPEIFLKAAKNLAVMPSNCLVIEDTENGIKAATRANMKSIGYLDRDHSRQDLSGSSRLVYSLKEVDKDLLLGIFKEF